ncbi:PTS sugar transporter subunit IIA [Enterococcus sp. DIV0086]|uniref:PTS sugar transporter subunit IIA domain-containing protein n=1 Tax=Enterococcus sp. DIV0086 TaxID=2774655 RepID=UPI003D2D7F9D
MIGFIITGHGSYASGIYEAMEMITGTQDKVKVISFLPGMTADTYKNEIVASINSLKKSVSEIVVFTDLLGGTPFKTVAEQVIKENGIEVVSGTNLSMLIEGSILRLKMISSQELANQLLKTGKDGIDILELVSKNDEVDVEDFSVGI